VIIGLALPPCDLDQFSKFYTNIDVDKYDLMVTIVSPIECESQCTILDNEVEVDFSLINNGGSYYYNFVFSELMQGKGYKLQCNNETKAIQYPDKDVNDLHRSIRLLEETTSVPDTTHSADSNNPAKVQNPTTSVPENTNKTSAEGTGVTVTGDGNQNAITAAKADTTSAVKDNIASEGETAKPEAGQSDAAKEAKAKDDAAKEAKAKDDAAKEAKAKDDAAKEAKAKDDIAKEAKAKDDIAKEAKAKDDAAKEAKAKDDLKTSSEKNKETSDKSTDNKKNVDEKVTKSETSDDKKPTKDEEALEEKEKSDADETE
jgi:hypothetical protein